MVNFLWGNSNQAFPASNARIKSEMKDYIEDKNRNFMGDYANALRNAKQENTDVDAIKQAFQDILKELLEEDLVDYIKNHEEGKQAVSNFTTYKVKNELVENKANSEFLNSGKLVLSSLFDRKTLNKLRGQGSVGLKSKESEVEDFDWEENYFEDIAKEEYTEQEQMEVYFKFSEALPADMDKYDPSEMKFSYGQDQIKFKCPLEDNELINRKEEHINETTLQQPNFYSRKSNIPIPRIKLSMDIKFPTSVIEELQAPPELELQEVEPILNKNNVPTGRYKKIGSPDRMNTSEFNALRIGKEQQRTKGMIEERIFSLDDKLFQLVKGSVSGAGKVVTIPETVFAGIKDKFYTELKQIEKTALSPYLKDPYNAYSYIGVANFKTNVRYINSLTRKTQKFFDPKVSAKDKYKTMEVITYKNNTPTIKTLTVQEAQALESEAWQNRNNKEKISNSEYVSLAEEKKLNYIPLYYIIESDTGEQVNPIGETQTTHKKINGYKLKNAPEDAYALIPKKQGKLVLKKPSLGVGYSNLQRKYGEGSLSEKTSTKDSSLLSEITTEEELESILTKFIEKKGTGQLVTKEGIQRTLDRNKDSKTVAAWLEKNKYVPAISFYKQVYVYDYKDADFMNQTEFEEWKRKPTKLRRGELKIEEETVTPPAPFAPEDNVIVPKKEFLLVNVNKLSGISRPALYEPIYEEEDIDDKRKRYNQKAAKRSKRRYQQQPDNFMEGGKEEVPNAENYSVSSPDKFGKVTDTRMSVSAGEPIDKGPLAYYENIEVAFSPVVLHVDIVMKHLGQFKITPYRRRKNEEMISVLEDLRDNIMTLKEKLGVE